MNPKKIKRFRDDHLRFQNGRCFYCGRSLSKDMATIHHRDHNPRNFGDQNVVACCHKCHRKLNVMTTIYRSGTAPLRREIIYQILRVTPSHLTKELVGSQPIVLVK